MLGANSKAGLVIDNHYVNKKLASVYDVCCGWSEDRDFYLSLATDSPLKILELGCGTGLVSRAYALNGHKVVGVDPSESMLAIAQKRTDAKTIEWVEAYAQSYRTKELFDLVIMTGHAFQVLLDEQDVQTLFDNIKSYLKPTGKFVFESRNPAVDWVSEWSGNSVEWDSEYGSFTVSIEALKSDADTLSFDQKYVFKNETLYSHSTLRFFSYEKILSFIRNSSLRVTHVYGDWSRSVFNPIESKEMIFVVQI